MLEPTPSAIGEQQNENVAIVRKIAEELLLGSHHPLDVRREPVELEIAAAPGANRVALVVNLESIGRPGPQVDGAVDQLVVIPSAEPVRPAG